MTSELDALFTAIGAQKHDEIERLLTHHPELASAQGQQGMTPIHMAAIQNDPQAIYLILCQHAPVDTLNDAGATPLFLAAARGNTEAVAYLLQTSPELDTRNEHGATALYMAARNGHEAIVRALLEAGASPHLSNHNNVTPLDIANNRGHRDIVRLLQKYTQNSRNVRRTEDAISNILKRK